MKKKNNLNIPEIRTEAEMRTEMFLLPKEVGRVLRIGDNSLYALLGREDCPFPVLRLTKQIVRIPTADFFRWYDSLKA